MRVCFLGKEIIIFDRFSKTHSKIQHHVGLSSYIVFGNQRSAKPVLGAWPVLLITLLVMNMLPMVERDCRKVICRTPSGHFVPK